MFRPPVQACAGCPPEVLKVAGDVADLFHAGRNMEPQKAGYGWPFTNPIPLIIEPPGYGPPKSAHRSSTEPGGFRVLLDMVGKGLPGPREKLSETIPKCGHEI